MAVAPQGSERGVGLHPALPCTASRGAQGARQQLHRVLLLPQARCGVKAVRGRAVLLLFQVWASRPPACPVLPWFSSLPHHGCTSLFCRVLVVYYKRGTLTWRSRKGRWYHNQ